MYISDDTIYLFFVSCFLGFQGLIQDESRLGGEESTTKGSFYIFQYLFHDGVLSTRQTLPLVMCHMHESALVMSQRLRVKPRDLLGSYSLGGFIFLDAAMICLGNLKNRLPIYFADFERKVEE